jgi:hypothetical protein
MPNVVAYLLAQRSCSTYEMDAVFRSTGRYPLSEVAPHLDAGRKGFINELHDEHEHHQHINRELH